MRVLRMKRALKLTRLSPAMDRDEASEKSREWSSMTRPSQKSRPNIARDRIESTVRHFWRSFFLCEQELKQMCTFQFSSDDYFILEGALTVLNLDFYRQRTRYVLIYLSFSPLFLSLSLQIYLSSSLCLLLRVFFYLFQRELKETQSNNFQNFNPYNTIWLFLVLFSELNYFIALLIKLVFHLYIAFLIPEVE